MTSSSFEETCCCAELTKPLTVHGDSLLASIRPMLPHITMLTLTWAGSVGTFAVRGGNPGSDLTALSGDGGYWQLAPRLADGLNGGSGGAVAACGGWSRPSRG